jgi:2-oxo-3-(phosphooxy)propyl 3-oxoalkanoate synthase
MTEVNESGRTADLSYTRTLNREALHRQAVSEVFLTDYRPLDGDNFACGAQTPLSHAYYSDQLARPESYDPLLLLECCRQASIYDLHIRSISGPDNATIIESVELELADQGPLALGPYPGELLLQASRSTARAGRKARHAFTFEMFMDGSFIGRAAVHGTSLPSGTLRAVRRRQRPAGAFMTSQLPEIRARDLVRPSRVGRQNPVNVVVADPALSSSGLQARVAVPPRNTSILEHDYDHLPGMAIVEAARQGALLALEPATRGAGATAGLGQPVRLRASFVRFAELDTPLILRAAAVTAAPGQSAIEVPVDLMQDGQLVATAAITFAMPE